MSFLVASEVRHSRVCTAVERGQLLTAGDRLIDALLRVVALWHALQAVVALLQHRQSATEFGCRLFLIWGEQIRLE